MDDGAGRGVGRTCRARLVLATSHAEALARALEPDNREAPRDLSIQCRSRDRLLECVVEVICDNPRGILRLRNTLDDILLNVKAALESLSSLET